MSIPAASLLDQVSAGGGAQQVAGKPSSPGTDAGIFAALLGNLEGATAETIAIPSGDQILGQATSPELAGAPANALAATLLPDAANADIANPSTPATGKTDGTATIATAISPEIIANARPLDALSPETRQQPSTASQGQQTQSGANDATLAKLTAGADGATLAKLTAGADSPLKTATAQQANTPGAQATGSQSVPDLRATPNQDNAARFASKPVKMDDSAIARQQGTSANPLTGLQSGLMRALGNSGPERADIAGTINTGDTLVPARDAAIVQNYSQQMRLAGDEVRAPVKSLAVEITAQARTGIKQFEIRMDPPELGRIDVRIDMKDNGSVTTRLVVERAETLDLLQRDARFLERALSDNGLKLDEGGLRMSLKGDGSGQHAQSGAGNTGDQAEHAHGQAGDETPIGLADSDPGTPSPSIIHQMVVNGGIDIRV